MKISQTIPNATYVIQSYQPGQVVIKNRCYQHSLIIMPDLVVNWSPRCFEELTAQHFNELIKYQLDIVLLGTGEKLRFPDRALFVQLQKQGIGIEIMNNGAVCRTYNLLITEDRKVAGLLLIG